jgi:hypothetical protein
MIVSALGDLQLQQSKWESALANYDSAIQHHPSNALAMWASAMCMLQLSVKRAENEYSCDFTRITEAGGMSAVSVSVYPSLTLGTVAARLRKAVEIDKLVGASPTASLKSFFGPFKWQ